MRQLDRSYLKVPLWPVFLPWEYGFLHPKGCWAHENLERSCQCPDAREHGELDSEEVSAQPTFTMHIQRENNVTLILGAPSSERDRLLAEEVVSISREGVPLVILDTKGTLVPLLLELELAFAVATRLEDVPPTGISLVINDGNGYLRLATSHNLDLSPVRVIASVDVVAIQPL